MYTLYCTFVVIASLGMVFLVWAKAHELKTSPGFLSRLSDAFDPIAENALKKTKYFFSHINKATLRALFHALSHGIFHLFGTVGLFVAKYYGRFIQTVRGVRAPKTGGVVSFFLKDVSESTKRDGEGKK